MKKKRMNRFVGLLLAIAMVVQINAGTVGTANVYADTTAGTTTVSESQSSSANSAGTSSDSGSSASESTSDTTDSSAQSSTDDTTTSSDTTGTSTDSTTDSSANTSSADSSESTTEQTDSASTSSMNSASEETVDSSSEESEVTVASVIDQGIWIGDDTTTTYTTLKDAVDAAAEGDVIHMNGTFDGSAVSGAVVGNGVTLDIVGNTTITGAGSTAGFTLGVALSADDQANGKAGAKLQTQDGVTLTMTGFSNAITVNSGSAITDGTYVMSDVSNGFVLSGTGKIEGTSRDKLNMTVTAKKNSVGFNTTGRANATDATNFTTPNFVKATVTINGGGQDGWTYRSVVTDDVTMTLSDIWLYGYPLYVSNSDFTISGRFNSSSWSGGHVLSVYGTPVSFVNSNVVVDGSRINVINADGLTVKNSTLTIQNSSDGGMNINYGSSVYMEDSTLKGVNNTKPLVAAGYSKKSNLYISGSSVIETSASSNGDVVGVNGEFVVTGGSYKTYFSSSYSSQQIPTNGSDNGSEKLTLFQLSDSSVTELSILNINGETYTYEVGNANADGTKNVWVPKTTVTFDLKNTNATFADGSTEERSYAAIRGQLISAYSKYYADGTWTDNTFEDPGTPVDKNGAQFLGWYYQDASGNEQEFDAATTPIIDNMVVYAKWTGNSVVYHNNGSDTVTENVPLGETSTVVKSFDDVVAQNSAFDITGKAFTSWNTKADGTGDTYQAGDTLSITDGTQVDLYAQYETVYIDVIFSANGGTFSDSSIVKKYPKVFDVKTDAQGGEYAVLDDYVEGTKLADYISEKDSSFRYPWYYLGSSSSSFATKKYYSQRSVSRTYGTTTYHYYYWYTDAAATTQASFTANTVLNADTTYYVGWDVNTDEVDQEDESITLDSEIESDSNPYSASETRELYQGSTFSITRSIDFTSFKTKVRKLSGNSPVIVMALFASASTDTDTTIEQCAGGLQAVVTIPEGVNLPSADNVSVSGLGDLFTVGNVAVDETTRTITIPITLNGSYTTIDELSAAVESVSDTASVTVSGLSISDEVYEDSTSSDTEDTLDITESIDGQFSFVVPAEEDSDAKAKMYSFSWGEAEDSTSIYSVKAVKNVADPMNLYGDILVGDDSQNSSVYQVLPGDTVDFTGALDVTPIQNNLDYLEQQFDESSSSDITLTKTDGTTPGVEFSMTMTVTFPDGIKIPDNLVAEIKDSSFGGFKIEDPEVNGQVVTVTFVLDDSQDETNGVIDTYAELKAAVDAAGTDGNGIMEILMPGFTVTTLGVNQQVTVNSLTGSFQAYATKGETTRAFSYSWNALQSCSTSDSEALGNGKDSTLSSEDNETISFTLISNASETLYGDILVNGNTENSSVYPVLEGDTVDFTGALDVKPIQTKLTYLESQYSITDDELSNITLKKKDGTTGVDFSMTMTVEFDPGITVPTDLSAIVKDDSFGDGFEIKSTVVDGQTVTVTFGLKDDTISTYEELKAAVDDAGIDGNGLMEILLPGLTVETGAADPSVTVKNFTGTFTAYATKTNEDSTDTTIPFVYSWGAQQSCSTTNSELLGNGKDYTQSSTDNKTIAFTLNVSSSQPLYGDILVDGNTENSAVYQVVQGDTVDFTGALDVTPIQTTIAELEDSSHMIFLKVIFHQSL
jgi:ribosome-associated protein YbcJ (S4-like RNA binding protein)